MLPVYVYVLIVVILLPVLASLDCAFHDQKEIHSACDRAAMRDKAMHSQLTELRH